MSDPNKSESRRGSVVTLENELEILYTRPPANALLSIVPTTANARTGNIWRQSAGLFIPKAASNTMGGKRMRRKKSWLKYTSLTL
mmetsp:Transcript_40458/g.61343  ORF Transcript_40458/g.61343 Transcript_40458/m.61343 type:complete len:85 (+) Transcript_40458:1389-1643(+)